MLKVQIGKGGVAPFEFKGLVEKFFDEDFLESGGFSGEIEIGGEIVNDGKTFIARGKAACRRNFTCDRCLTAADENFVCEFDEELAEEDISENLADITELVRDTILAGLPIRNLCSADCKGLCPICGKNLNDGECDCDKFIVDPRLASLKDLKLD